MNGPQAAGGKLRKRQVEAGHAHRSGRVLEAAALLRVGDHADDLAVLPARSEHVLPDGSRSLKYRFANAWLMITAGADVLVSVSRNVRPLDNGRRSVSK